MGKKATSKARGQWPIPHCYARVSRLTAAGVIRSRIMKSELSVHESFASIENNSPTRERDHKVLTKESILKY
jgi:predicted protein tyrosine phosphatase